MDENATYASRIENIGVQTVDILLTDFYTNKFIIFQVLPPKHIKASRQGRV